MLKSTPYAACYDSSRMLLIIGEARLVEIFDIISNTIIVSIKTKGIVNVVSPIDNGVSTSSLYLLG